MTECEKQDVEAQTEFKKKGSQPQDTKVQLPLHVSDAQYGWLK